MFHQSALPINVFQAREVEKLYKKKLGKKDKKDKKLVVGRKFQEITSPLLAVSFLM